MNIHFELNTSDSLPGYTPEAEIIAAPSKYADFLAPAKRAHYARFFMVNDQEEEIFIHDEMQSLIVHLCLMALQPLIEGKPYTYNLMMGGEPIQLIPQNEHIEIILPDMHPVKFDKLRLIRELYACAHRYFDLIDRLPPLGHEKSMAVIKAHTQHIEAFIKESGILQH